MEFYWYIIIAIAAFNLIIISYLFKRNNKMYTSQEYTIAKGNEDFAKIFDEPMIKSVEQAENAVIKYANYDKKPISPARKSIEYPSYTKTQVSTREFGKDYMKQNTEFETMLNEDLPDMSNWNKRQITDYVKQKTGINIEMIDDYNDYIDDYKEWKASYIKLAQRELNEYYKANIKVIEDGDVTVDRIDAKFEPAIDFNSMTCKEIGAYVKKQTNVNPADLIEPISDYDEYKIIFIDVAEELLKNFNKNEEVAEEFLFFEMNTNQITDYVLDETGLDIKLITNMWSYEPEYPIYKLKFVILARKLLAENRKKLKKTEFPNFNNMNTSKIIDYVKDITGYNIKEETPNIPDYSKYKTYIIKKANLFLAKFEFEKLLNEFKKIK